MKSFVGACMSILLGISILVGLFIFKYKGDNKKLYSFIESLGLIGFVLLGVFYVLPECIGFLEDNYNLVQCYSYLFLMILLGILIIKIVMYFLPKRENELNDLSYSHVILAIIGVPLLFTEGIVVYNTKNSYLNLFLLLIKFFLYNSIFGVVLVTNLKKHRFGLIKSFKGLIIIFVFCLIGYLLSFNGNFLWKNSFVMGSVLGVIIGMLFYLVIRIYVGYFKENKNSSAKTLGLIVGGIVLLLSNLL